MLRRSCRAKISAFTAITILKTRWRILWRLDGKRVEACAGEVTALQRFGERAFVNQFAASAVHNANARLHLREGSGVQHVIGFRGKRYVKRHVIALRVQLRQ